MTAAQFDLTRVNNYPIEQGVTLTLQFVYWEDEAKTQVKDLTGYTARMQVRDAHDSEDIALEVTTEGSAGDNIVLGGIAGTIVVHATAATTAALAAPFKGVYDIELIDAGGVPERFVEGQVQVTPEVTR